MAKDLLQQLWNIFWYFRFYGSQRCVFLWRVFCVWESMYLFLCVCVSVSLCPSVSVCVSVCLCVVVCMSVSVCTLCKYAVVLFPVGSVCALLQVQGSWSTTGGGEERKGDLWVKTAGKAAQEKLRKWKENVFFIDCSTWYISWSSSCHLCPSQLSPFSIISHSHPRVILACTTITRSFPAELSYLSARIMPASPICQS